MLFKKKKKDMIDVRELQKRGVVRIPKENIIIPQNKEGFVELSQTSSTPTATATTTPTGSNANFFGFMDSSTPATSTTSSAENYGKREVDAKVSELDNKLYKLEQRLELLEKKAGVSSEEQKVGPAGW